MLAVLCLSLLGAGNTASAEEQKHPATLLSAKVEVTPPAMTLQELEQMALKNNPTLRQAQSLQKGSVGRAKQAGLMPNPVVGFAGSEFAFRALDKKSEYFGFAAQTIPLGGKLKKDRRIYQREVDQAQVESSAQRQRIINAVRSLFYEALAAQQQVDLASDLSKIATVAKNTTAQLFNVGQADKPDYLEAEIESEEAEHDLQVARNALSLIWKSLACVVGSPNMEFARLEGNLEEAIPAFNEQELLASLLSESPQVKGAQARIDRAKAVLVRAKAEPVPDLFLLGAIGGSTELLETTSVSTAPIKATGLVANTQVGFTLPLWDRNQGGIASAKADLEFAQTELDRIKLTLTAQFAAAFNAYKNAYDSVRRYREVIIPKAEQAYSLYKARYKEMSASYPQVLIAQRTLFQSKQRYLGALMRLQQIAAQIEGHLLDGALDAPSLQLNRDHLELVGTGAVSESSNVNLDPADNVNHYWQFR